MVPRCLEGFLAGPPSSIFDYFTSIHTIPLCSSIVLTACLNICGFNTIWILMALGTGAAATVLVFALQPIPILSPIGGRYNVGITFLDGRRSQSMPPLAVFYPTSVKPEKNGLPYIPYGDGRFLKGVATHARIPEFLLSDEVYVRMKVTPNAEPVPLLQEGKTPFPVVLFSHGLAGYHCLYSCFLADLAARGVIVVGIGHCDGSASFMRDGGSEDNEVPFKSLGWEVPARESQLAARVKETRQTIKRVSGKEFWTQVGFKEEHVEKFISSEFSTHLVGHSFGGATALASALEENDKQKISSVVAFDPWGLPLKNEHFLQSIQSGRKVYTTPTLLIHSEEWVNWKESWNFFQEATTSVLSQPEVSSLHESEKHGLFVTETCGGVTHTALTDVGVLSPFLHGGATQMVPPRAQIVELANRAIRFIKRQTKREKEI